MSRLRRPRLLILMLPVLLAGVLVAGSPVYQHVTDGRPLCLPTLALGRPDTMQTAPDLPLPETIQIPGQNDWVDYGPVLETGAEGAWDFLWAGVTPVSIVRKEGTFYFYYVAADGYRSFDGDARHRAIGVATSQDGLRFDKFEGNPIMTHRPYDGEEEGANSGAVTLDEDGRFVMVYGAASGPDSSIVADARLAYSTDGLTFADAGRVLHHCALGLYGAGDEIFPVALLRQNDGWVVYYTPNGMPNTERTLGAAWGPDLLHLNSSAMVLDEATGELPVSMWGNIIAYDRQTLLFFGQRLWWPDTFVEVRAATAEAPQFLSEPVARYDVSNLKRGIVYLDRERRTWFLYYNDFSRFWKVKLAPYGPNDDTPPSAPRVMGRAIGDGEVRLSWQEAVDVETGIVEYRIYRDGQPVGKTRELVWQDADLQPERLYHYQVTAVNFHGEASDPGEADVRTLADKTPPHIESVAVAGDLSAVRVFWSEAVAREQATEVERYEISGGIVVQDATLTGGGRVALLRTTAHEPGSAYRLTVRHMVDDSSRGNGLDSASRIYTAGEPVLAGRWLAGDAGASEDTSGYGLDATIHGAAPLAAANGGLVFDGVDDYVQIVPDERLQAITGRSFTLSAWINPNGLPASEQGARIVGRAGEHPNEFVGLSLSSEGRVEAAIWLADGNRIAISSPPLLMGQWHHVAMVVDVRRGRLALVADGATSAQQSAPISGNLLELTFAQPRDDRSGAYFIGATMPQRGAGSFFDAYFDGAIRDVRIYDRALSSSDLQLFR